MKILKKHLKNQNCRKNRYTFLDEVSKIVKPGITTDQIDKIYYEFINDNKAYRRHYFIEVFLSRVALQ